MKNDILITGANGFIGSRIKGGRKYYGDILSIGDMLNATKGMKGIIHLAARSNKRKCDNDPSACIASNVVGLLNILNVATVKGMWVLFVSTHQVTENHLYGLSKLMGEELCRLFNARGLRVYILRLPIVYGKGESEDKVVSRTIAKMKRGIVPKAESNGMFHFFYVDDVINMIEKEVAFIGDISKVKKYSFRDLTDGIKEMLHGKKKK